MSIKSAIIAFAFILIAGSSASADDPYSPWGGPIKPREKGIVGGGFFKDAIKESGIISSEQANQMDSINRQLARPVEVTGTEVNGMGYFCVTPEGKKFGPGKPLPLESVCVTTEGTIGNIRP